MYFKNANQLKHFLKKEALRLNINIPHIYNMFFARIFLERLCNENRGMFLVKGSFSQYVHLGKLVRPITDIDLITRGEASSIIKFMNNGLTGTDDLSFKITDIADPTSNNVVKLRGKALFDNIVHPLKIDIKAGSESIYETNYKPVLPIFNGDQIYYINTPSMEEHFAEKLCIIAERISQNSLSMRMKDFYDVYQIHSVGGSKYDSEKLAIYFARMLTERGRTNLGEVNINSLNGEFISQNKDSWDKTKQSKEFLDEVSFEEAVYYTKAVLSEQLNKNSGEGIKSYSLKPTYYQKKN